MSQTASAFKFVILIGIVSLFADVTYEGARSLTGPYLDFLGASAATVGFVAGFGEFFGYGMRFISGYFSDRTGRYWPITIMGYLINLAAVPLLALAGNWWVASMLMIMERAGKGIRVPARDAMLSHAAARLGMGWGFGLHEALDQAGAMSRSFTYRIDIILAAWLSILLCHITSTCFPCYVHVNDFKIHLPRSEGFGRRTAAAHRIYCFKEK